MGNDGGQVGNGGEGKVKHKGSSASPALLPDSVFVAPTRGKHEMTLEAAGDSGCLGNVPRGGAH